MIRSMSYRGSTESDPNMDWMTLALRVLLILSIAAILGLLLFPW